MNDALVPDMAGGKYLSLFAAVLDPKDGRMEWCNAGHNPPFLFRAGDRSVLPLERTGRILGILPGEPCGPGEPVKMEKGDALLLYTDGVTEARGAGGELFGPERLESALKGTADQEPEAILDGVRASVRAFTGGARHDDDITLVAVAYGLPCRVFGRAGCATRPAPARGRTGSLRAGPLSALAVGRRAHPLDVKKLRRHPARGGDAVAAVAVRDGIDLL
jgi:hypothetical protein